MELSFSSEREEYDDDPTAARALASPSVIQTAAKPSAVLLPVQKPLQAGGWGLSSANTAAASSTNAVAKPAPAPAASSSSGGGFFASLTRPKAASTTAASGASKAGVDSNTTVEAVQAFDAAEVSISRRSSSRSHSSQRRRDKAARAAEAEARRKRLENAAPGAIDDDGDLSARKPAKSNAASSSSAFSAAPAASSGGGAGKSMIADMGRKGGKGAFALDKELDFSSEEDEEDGHGGKVAKPKQAKKPKDEKKRGDDDAPAASASAASGGAAARDERRGNQSDVAPLINSVAFDFVCRRWLSTLLGGVVATWTAAPSDERMPRLPGWIVCIQLTWLLYPAAIGVLFNILRYEGIIEPQGVMALIAGVVAALAHLLVHGIHRRVVRRSTSAAAAGISSTSTRVADESSSLSSASSNLDNCESLLQLQVKAAAIKSGSLPPKQKAASQKKRHPDADAEDSASRPPDVPRREPVAAAAGADSDDDADEAPVPANTPALGMFSPPLWAFIVSPKPRSFLRMISHAFISGIMVAGCCFFLEWHSIAAQIDPPLSGSALSPSAIVFLVFSWISFCLCFYSGNIRSPAAELNKYSSGNDGFLEEEIQNPWGRCFWAGCIIVYDLVLRLIVELGDPSRISQTAIDVHRVLVIFFPFLPLLFAIGALPPLDALFWWATEQLNVVIFGGTTCANNVRSMISLLLHTVATIVVFLASSSRPEAGMLFAVGLSFLLSWNGLPLSWGAAVSPSPEKPDLPFAAFRTRSLWPFTQRATLVKISLALLICGVGIALGPGGKIDLVSELQELHVADIAFDLLCVVLALVLIVLGEIYKPYLFSTIKNPFYVRLVLSKLRPGIVASRPKVSKHELLLWGIRLYLVLYVAFHQTSSGSSAVGKGSGWILSQTDAAGRLTLVAYAALLFRAFHVIWSRDLLQTLIHILLVVVVNLATGSSALDAPVWHALGWNVRFLIMGFVWDRFRTEFCPKIWMVASFTYTVFAYPKQAVRHPRAMKVACILLVPYHISLVAVSSFLATPVLPLLGSPIFLLAFPRPQRIWAQWGGKYGINEASSAVDKAGGGQDTIFYQHMFPSVYASLDLALRTGTLSYSSLEAGSFFLLRLEPYLIWVAVLERGLGYVVLQMKGLELATTSCHTVEALRVDEVLEAQLDPSSFSSAPTVSPLSNLYSYTPRAILSNIRSFSITRNSLTGIIDDRTNLEILSGTFLRCICKRVYEEVQAYSQGPQASMSSLPKHWLAPSVSSYDLQQLEARTPWPGEYVKFLMEPGPKLSDTDATLYKRVCLSAFAIVDHLAADVVASGGRPTPAHVLATFEGRIGASLQAEYLLSPAAADLKALVLSAHRSAFKCMYDCAAMAELEVLSSVEEDHMRQFHELLAEQELEWLLAGTVQGNAEWASALSRGDTKLFSIARASSGGSNAYTSLTLELTTVSLRMATLSPTAVRAFWCSLAMEMLFFANDDDERYSIQAHPQMLRNLTVQASEPPFGYPVFSGLPTALSTN